MSMNIHSYLLNIFLLIDSLNLFNKIFFEKKSLFTFTDGEPIGIKEGDRRKNIRKTRKEEVTAKLATSRKQNIVF